MDLVYAKNYKHLSEMMEQREDGVAWTCGVPYVEDRQVSGQQLVSVPLFRGEPIYHSIVLTKKERSESKLADFKGKVLAYSDRRSNSGFISPAYALKKEGINLQDHFSILINAHDHTGSIEALLGGLAQVAAVDEYIWVEYKRANPDAGKRLKEIARMGPFPFTPIVAGKGVNQEVVNNLQQALTDMVQDQEGKGILNDLHLNGFVVKSPSFYQPIEEMLNYIKTVSK